MSRSCIGSSCASVLLVAIALLMVLCNLANASPMLYKKNHEQKFEADLVPVSSTVIPLSVLEVSYGSGGQPSEEYKMAYIKKLRKKVLEQKAKQQQQQHQVSGTGTITAEEQIEDPDTLITIKKKYHNNDASTKAKVKGIEIN